MERALAHVVGRRSGAVRERVKASAPGGGRRPDAETHPAIAGPVSLGGPRPPPGPPPPSNALVARWPCGRAARSLARHTTGRLVATLDRRSQIAGRRCTAKAASSRHRQRLLRGGPLRHERHGTWRCRPSVVVNYGFASPWQDKRLASRIVSEMQGMCTSMFWISKVQDLPIVDREVWTLRSGCHARSMGA